MQHSWLDPIDLEEAKERVYSRRRGKTTAMAAFVLASIQTRPKYNSMELRVKRAFLRPGRRRLTQKMEGCKIKTRPFPSDPSRRDFGLPPFSPGSRENQGLFGPITSNLIFIDESEFWEHNLTEHDSMDLIIPLKSR